MASDPVLTVILPTFNEADNIVEMISALQTTLQKWLAHDVYDGSAFCRDFDFGTVVDLADGLRREVAWYRSTT